MFEHLIDGLEQIVYMFCMQSYGEFSCGEIAQIGYSAYHVCGIIRGFRAGGWVHGAPAASNVVSR